MYCLYILDDDDLTHPNTSPLPTDKHFELFYFCCSHPYSFSFLLCIDLLIVIRYIVMSTWCFLA